jgi:hypothetical protein
MIHNKPICQYYTPENFKGHIYDGFYEFLKLSKSFPIEVYKKTANMLTIRLTLIDFREHKIEESLFQIPELIEDEELNSLNFGTDKIMKIKQ